MEKKKWNGTNMCTQSQSEHLVSQFYWLFFLYFYGDVKIFFNLKVIRDKKVRSLGLCYIYASTRFVVLFFLVIYASLIIWYKFKENFYISTAIQEKQSVKLRTRVFWLWLCIIWDHRRRRTCNNLQNFTKFSRTSIHPHSGRIVRLNFCYPPTFRHWTSPLALKCKM